MGNSRKGKKNPLGRRGFFLFMSGRIYQDIGTSGFGSWRKRFSSYSRYLWSPCSSSSWSYLLVLSRSWSLSTWCQSSFAHKIEKLESKLRHTFHKRKKIVRLFSVSYSFNISISKSACWCSNYNSLSSDHYIKCMLIFIYCIHNICLWDNLTIIKPHSLDSLIRIWPVNFVDTGYSKFTHKRKSYREIRKCIFQHKSFDLSLLFFILGRTVCL